MIEQSAVRKKGKPQEQNIQRKHFNFPVLHKVLNLLISVLQKLSSRQILIQINSSSFYQGVQINCYVVSDYKCRLSVSSSFPCHQLFAAKFQRSSYWSAASNYLCMLFFASTCLFYLQFFLSIADVPNLTFCTEVLKTQVVHKMKTAWSLLILYFSPSAHNAF